MAAVARRIEDGTAWQSVGTVTAATDDGFVVHVGGDAVRARRAAGCLLQPEVDDLVLVAVAREGAWVLTVLEREAGAASRVSLDGDLELRLSTGKLTLSAQEGVDVASGAPLRVVAGEVDVHAGAASVSAQAVSLFGTAVSLEAETVRVAAAAVEQVVDRLTQRAKRVYRFVEEFEQLRAGRLDYVAKKLMELHGGSASVTADELVKVDGEQIHVG